MEETKHKELHAAYLCVKSSVAEDLSSPQEITLALQYAGYNPSQTMLKRIWSENTPNGITFEEYLSICVKLKSLNANNVYGVFSSVLGSTDGKVPVSKLKELALGDNDQRILSERDIDYILQEANVVQSDTVDCAKLARVICHTINELKQLSVEKLDEKTSHQRQSSKTFTKRHHKANSNSQNGNTWYTSVLKGNFYVDHPSIISHQFYLNISHDGETVVKIEPSALEQGAGTTRPMDILAYIFREGNDGGRSFLGVTESRDSESVNFWQGELKAGNYLIIPFTSGVYLPKLDLPSSVQTEKLKLITKEEDTGRVLLTRQFRTLLLRIFEQLDLDSSGGLSKQEFNLYNWRTSGEEVQEDEWAVVLSNFAIHNNELTAEGFLDLHQLEAEDSGGIEDDLWLSMQAMGYSVNGSVVGCAGYNMSALSQVCNPSLQVCGLRSGGLLLDKAIVRHVMENSEPVRIKNMIDLIKYEYISVERGTVVLQNKAQRSVTLRVDISKSTNIISHRQELTVTLELPAKSAIVAHHILPADGNLPWNLECTEVLI